MREYLGRAAAGIGWPLAADVTDESLMARLFVNAGVRAGARFHPEPGWPALVRELKQPGNRGKIQGTQVQHGPAPRGEMAEIRQRCPSRQRNEA